MSERAPRPTRADYAYWETVTTRWADVDVYGHMNNARYFEVIDTVVNNHLVHATGTDIRTLPAIGVVAEVSCRYFAEVGYPEPIEVGVVAERVGRSSVTYRVGLFQGEGEEASAELFARMHWDDGGPSVVMAEKAVAASDPRNRKAQAAQAGDELLSRDRANRA